MKLNKKNIFVCALLAIIAPLSPSYASIPKSTTDGLCNSKTVISQAEEKDKVYLSYASSAVVNQMGHFTMHYSHRSHSSHYSHRSHYSSSRF